jgi:ParB-like chromosome segregation protein Spo0J
MTHHSLPIVPNRTNGSQLAVGYLPIDQLRPDPGNARQHSAKQVRQIAKSIETFGFNVALLVDAECNVIAGHGRLLAAKRLGWHQVPTIRLDHLSEAQKRAFMIADNRLARSRSGTIDCSPRSSRRWRASN